MILYLHGFRSSPASHKARRLERRMAACGLADHFWCQQLPHAPIDAMAMIDQVIGAQPAPPTLIGSSLGGFYASIAASRHDLSAILINPAVPASVPLESFIGTQTNLYTGQSFEFTADHIGQLRELEHTNQPDPQRLWLMLETGDEVLDYRAAFERFAGARLTLIEGGDHSFTRFADYLDDILRFAGFAP